LNDKRFHNFSCDQTPIISLAKIMILTASMTIIYPVFEQYNKFRIISKLVGDSIRIQGTEDSRIPVKYSKTIPQTLDSSNPGPLSPD